MKNLSDPRIGHPLTNLGAFPGKDGRVNMRKKARKRTVASATQVLRLEFCDSVKLDNLISAMAILLLAGELHKFVKFRRLYPQQFLAFLRRP